MMNTFEKHSLTLPNDVKAVPQLASFVEEVAESHGADLSVTMSLFLGVLKAAKAKGGHVYITGMNNDIIKVFAMTGFTNLFEYR